MKKLVILSISNVFGFGPLSISFWSLQLIDSSTPLPRVICLIPYPMPHVILRLPRTHLGNRG